MFIRRVEVVEEEDFVTALVVVAGVEGEMIDKDSSMSKERHSMLQLPRC